MFSIQIGRWKQHKSPALGHGFSGRQAQAAVQHSVLATAVRQPLSSVTLTAAHSSSAALYKRVCGWRDMAKQQLLKHTGPQTDGAAVETVTGLHARNVVTE